jgi:hypothetical protein
MVVEGGLDQVGTKLTRKEWTSIQDSVGGGFILHYGAPESFWCYPTLRRVTRNDGSLRAIMAPYAPFCALDPP